MNKPRLHHAAVHEAGHVAAEWLLGSTPHAAHLLAPGEEIKDGKGRMQRACAGLVESGMSYNPYHLLGSKPAYELFADQAELLASAHRHGMADAAALYAGPMAEARHRHLHLVFVMLNGGQGDEQRIDDIAADLCVDDGGRARFRVAASGLARRLLRGRMPGIVALASTLNAAGSLDGDRLEALLPDLFGPKPPYLAAVRP